MIDYTVLLVKIKTLFYIYTARFSVLLLTLELFSRRPAPPAKKPPLSNFVPYRIEMKMNRFLAIKLMKHDKDEDSILTPSLHACSVLPLL